ncbi:Os11g0302500 [Oryza sativa Japonica Group]|uniref:Os11g0302500 protein n=1 Tax=Oryza sativa subsp. japonica TaxID=39947 RepID=A0A0P0Y1C2_ORYSJ|nr:hypothetical protein EE612_054944 [Oryza sativa]BAT13688.1 Os11g0302500 [Oryza sativa Japonica Group]
MAAPRRPAAAKARNGGGAGRTSRWMAADGSKRWGETFFLLYTPFWLTLCLGVVVPFKLYERFTELEYLVVGLVSTVPAFVIPLFLVGKADSVRSLKDRYWVKVSVLYDLLKDKLSSKRKCSERRPKLYLFNKFDPVTCFRYSL